MQEIFDIHGHTGLFGGEIRLRPFPEVLKEVQEHITKNYASTLKDDPDESRELVKSYIQKYLENNHLGVENTKQEELCELIYGEMTGFSFLTKYLYRDDVEEININQWKDVKITYSNGEILPCKEHFNSPQHAIDVIRRMLHKSGMIFDSAQTIVVGHLSNKIRITVMGDGVIDRDKGLSASIRIVNPRKLTKQQFVDYGTATAEMLDLLAACYCHGVSMCITGATSSGKTTLMSWILGQVPYNKRIVTLEQGCREFDLTAEDGEGNVLNNVVHLVTRFSDDPKQNITLVKLLETTLTINPDCVAVAEMKGAESMQAINAANTGHSVITTIHANSCADQEERLPDGDMFFAGIEPGEVTVYEDAYAKGRQLEMWITLDVEENQCILEYNPNCPWYRTMGSYSIDLDKGLENVRRLLEYGQEQGITDFNRLLAVYHNSTGLGEKLEDARGNMRLSEYLDSPQAEEQRRRYREMLEQEEPENGEEEMER